MADLSRREQMMEQRNPPALAEQYETLDRMIAEASTMVPSYSRMADSIKLALSFTSRATELELLHVYYIHEHY